MKKIFVVIPAYNEEKTIGKVVKDVIKNGYKNVVVIDDGSSDRTAEIARKSGAIVLKHIINRGQGAALQTGIDYSLMSGADIIVTFDADGQHLASEIKNIVKPVINGYGVSLGSRFLKKCYIPLSKKIILKLGILFTWIVSGLRLSDVHNGFRAFSRKSAMKLNLKMDGFEHASEILDKIKRYKFKYKEVPVTIVYKNMKSQSPLNAFKMGFRIILKKIMRW